MEPQHQHQHNCNTKSYPSIRCSQKSSMEETEPNTTCKICLEKKWRREIFVLDCGDKYCYECIATYLTTWFVTDGYLKKVPCPNPECDRSIHDTDIRETCPTDVYFKYKEFHDVAHLLAETTCRWCPRPDCNTPVVADPSHESFPCLSCSKCSTQFCFTCSTDWHPGLSCEENMKELKKSQNLEEKQTEEWKKKHHVRKCPRCAVDIEKDTGCNHMTCSSCNYQFCWICKKKFTTDHYRKGSCKSLRYTSHPTLKKRLLTLGGTCQSIFRYFINH